MTPHTKTPIASLLFLSLLVVIAFVPLSASADILPQCTLTYGQVDGADYKICGLCDFWHLANNIVNFLLFQISIPLMTVIFLYGGTRWVISGGSPAGIAAGRTAMTNALIGFLIAFSAWAVVNTIITTLANERISAAWSKIPECVKPDTTSLGLAGFAAGSGFTNSLLDSDGFQDGYNLNDASTRTAAESGQGFRNSDDIGNLPEVQTASAATINAKLAPYQVAISAAAQKYNVPESRIKAIIMAESSGNPSATHTDGDGKSSYGLMQVRPDTARQIEPSLRGKSDGEVAAYLQNNNNNIDLGTRYYGSLMGKYGGNRDLASSAYNGGPGANKASQNCPGQMRWQCTCDQGTVDQCTKQNTGYAPTRRYIANIQSMEKKLETPA
jgi:hypothetical protein